MTTKADGLAAVLKDTRSPATQKAFIGAFETLVTINEHPPCQMFSTRTITLGTDEFSRLGPPLLDGPPTDPLRKAAESITLGSPLYPDEIAWARGHDWYDSDVDGVLIVTDRYTYKGRAFEDRIIWGGTFEELKAWAGY